MREFIYHLRYAFHLYYFSDMSWRLAWNYPYDPKQGDGDPIEDADAELEEWGRDG